eukprot:3973099-Heterocapsa_arctica.AAC.1
MGLPPSRPQTEVLAETRGGGPLGGRWFATVHVVQHHEHRAELPEDGPPQGGPSEGRGNGPPNICSQRLRVADQPRQILHPRAPRIGVVVAGPRDEEPDEPRGSLLSGERRLHVRHEG